MAVSYRKQVIYRKLCAALCLCGFVLDLVAFLVPTWVSYIIGGYRHYYGLFTTCMVQSGNQACGTVGPNLVNGSFQAGQAFGVLGLIAYFVSLVCCVIVLCWPRPWKRRLLYAASVSSLATALFTMLTLVLFFTSHADHGTRLDFGYYIAIAASVMSPLIAIFSFYIAKITSFPPKKPPSIIHQPLSIIDLDSVSTTGSHDDDSGSWEVPYILREFTEDNLHQIAPEFRSYTKEETKINPSFFFNHRPSKEVMDKIRMRDMQKQSSQTGSQKGFTPLNPQQPSPSGSRNDSDVHPSPSGSRNSSNAQPSPPWSRNSPYLQPSPTCSRNRSHVQQSPSGSRKRSTAQPSPPWSRNSPYLQPSPSVSRKGSYVQQSPSGSWKASNMHPSPSGSHSGSSFQPSPSGSQNGMHLQPSNLGLQNGLSGSQHNLNVSVTHLNVEVDTYRSRCTTPVEEVETASSYV